MKKKREERKKFKKGGEMMRKRLKEIICALLGADVTVEYLEKLESSSFEDLKELYPLESKGIVIISDDTTESLADEMRRNIINCQMKSLLRSNSVSVENLESLSDENLDKLWQLFLKEDKNIQKKFPLSGAIITCSKYYFYYAPLLPKLDFHDLISSISMSMAKSFDLFRSLFGRDHFRLVNRWWNLIITEFFLSWLSEEEWIRKKWQKVERGLKLSELANEVLSERLKRKIIEEWKLQKEIIERLESKKGESKEEWQLAEERKTKSRLGLDPKNFLYDEIESLLNTLSISEIMNISGKRFPILSLSAFEEMYLEARASLFMILEKDFDKEFKQYRLFPPK